MVFRGIQFVHTGIPVYRLPDLTVYLRITARRIPVYRGENTNTVYTGIKIETSELGTVNFLKGEKDNLYVNYR